MPTLTNEERAAAEEHLRTIPAKDRERHEQLLRDAQTVYRAFEGWHHTVKSPDEGIKKVEESRADYHAGRFLIERLGAERLLDPVLLATLLGLRQNLLADLDHPAAADRMLVDLAVLAYYNALRVQGWIGNLAPHAHRA